MAKGIRESDTNHLITFHPVGGHNSTQYLRDAAYIDFHTAQTSHASINAIKAMLKCKP